MKLANLDGRAVLVTGDDETGHRAVDVAAASGGRFGPDLRAVYDHWPAFRDFASTVTSLESPVPTPFDAGALGCPVPEPRQVFGIAVNYRTHAEEMAHDVPPVPAVFTKFPASLAGPASTIEVPNDTVDWEVELVVVMGRRADRVSTSAAWDHVAGLTVGQDISDRTLQFLAGAQYSMGKSRRGFGPMGPWVVTVDELDDPDDLALGCSVSGEVVQQARTGDMVFDVAHLVAELSAVVPLLPGDVIFTGTPPGVGAGRTPPRFLRPGDVLESWVDGIGTMRNEVEAERAAPSIP